MLLIKNLDPYNYIHSAPTIHFAFLINMFSEKFKRPEFLARPSKPTVLFAATFGSVMWFWILFRARHDGPYLLVTFYADIYHNFLFRDLNRISIM